MARDDPRDASLIGAASDLLTAFSDLVRKELRLAHAEVSQKLNQCLRAGIWMAAAAILGLLAALLVVEAAVFALASAGLASLSDYAATAGQYADRAREGLSAGSDQMSRQAQSAAQNAAETIREQPLLVAALGLVTGAAVASFFPSTEVERRTFGATGRTMVDAVSETGENLVQAAGEAAQHLKDDAAARGMTPEGVKQMARAATDTFSKTVAGTREQNTGAASPPRTERTGE